MLFMRLSSRQLRHVHNQYIYNEFPYSPANQRHRSPHPYNPLNINYTWYKDTQTSLFLEPHMFNFVTYTYNSSFKFPIRKKIYISLFIVSSII